MLQSNPEFKSHTPEHERPGLLAEAKDFGQSLGDDLKRLSQKLSHRASLEVKNTMRELQIKIISGIGAAFAVTYAVFWLFAALALWLYPSVPYEYSVTGIAVFHIVVAGVLYYFAQRPVDLDDSAKEAVEKSKKEIQDVFNHLAVKTNEIKEVANESLNPMNKVKRNPEAFLVGSFLLGVGLSIFMPKSANGSHGRRSNSN